jgi:hypothetical protein
VPRAGLEPAQLSPRDFKSLVSTYFTTEALFNIDNSITEFSEMSIDFWAQNKKILIEDFFKNLVRDERVELPTFAV